MSVTLVTVATVGLLAATSILLVPGLLISFLCGLRGLRAFALAGPLSLAMLAGFGIVLGSAKIRFSLGAVAIAVAALVIAAAVVLVHRRRSAPSGQARSSFRRSLRRALPLIIAFAVSAIAIATITIAAVGDPRLVNQTYDGIFHESAAASILTTGDASSLDLYGINHYAPGINFYPAAWHVLVAITAQLSGVGVVAAGTICWIAVSALVWVPGIALLTDTLLSGRPERRAAVVVSALLASAMGVFPFLLLSWGTLFPTFLAYAEIPSGLALIVMAFTVARRLDLVRLSVVFALWLVAAMLSHPRSLFGLGVIVAPFILWKVAQWYRALFGRRRSLALGILFATLGVIALVGVTTAFVLARVYDLAARPLADHLNGGPAVATQGIGQSVWQALAMAPPLPTGGTAPATPVLAVLVLISLGVLLARGPHRWLVVSFVLVVALYALAAGSNSDFAKVATGLWYKDKYRLISLLPVITVPALALALVQGRHLLSIRVPRLAANGAFGAFVLVAMLTSWFGGGMSAMRAAIGSDYAVTSRADSPVLLDRDDYHLLDKLDTVVPVGEKIIGNPWNGAALTWAVSQREPVFPHLTGVWDPDRLMVQNYLGTASINPAVCTALARLDVHYLYYSPSELWGGNDPQAKAFAALQAAATAPGFTPVLRAGSAVLYRITACD